MTHKKRDSRLTLVAAVLVIAALASGLYLVLRWWDAKTAKPEPRGEYSGRHVDTIEVDGVSYSRRANLTTVLLMGVDRDGDVEVTGYRNGGQADFLRLLVVDGGRKRVAQVQIDRDTMTPITILGVLGNKSGVRTAQICLSHGFGDGREQSCLLTADAVSNLLLGAPVDFYAAMNLDGIAALNDWVGGVTVTIEDDFSAFDPSMAPGATVTLHGDQAELFVRSRRSIGVGTNEARMRRQQEYLSELFSLMSARFHDDKDAIGGLFDTLSPYLVTDMARGRLINEAWAARDYETEFITLAGEYAVGGDGFKEFHVDQDALQKTVLELFYEEVK